MMPNPPCGTSGTVKYGDCENEGVSGWQRWATQEEIDYFHSIHDLPAHIHDHVDVQVVVCDEHTLDPDLATHVHDAICHLPVEPNGCEVCAEFGGARPNDD
jgi:hypothetical protein